MVSRAVGRGDPALRRRRRTARQGRRLCDPGPRGGFRHADRGQLFGYHGLPLAETAELLQGATSRFEATPVLVLPGCRAALHEPIRSTRQRTDRARTPRGSAASTSRPRPAKAPSAQKPSPKISHRGCIFRSQSPLGREHLLNAIVFDYRSRNARDPESTVGNFATSARTWSKGSPTAWDGKLPPRSAGGGANRLKPSPALAAWSSEPSWKGAHRDPVAEGSDARRWPTPRRRKPRAPVKSSRPSQCLLDGGSDRVDGQLAAPFGPFDAVAACSTRARR